MIYQSVNGKIENTQDPKELAKAIWDFYLFQYETALKDEIEIRCELDSYTSANNSAANEWRKNDNELGWGPPQPYSEAIIDIKKFEAERAKQNLAEAKALLNFVRDRFIDKFIS